MNLDDLLSSSEEGIAAGDEAILRCRAAVSRSRTLLQYFLSWAPAPPAPGRSLRRVGSRRVAVRLLEPQQERVDLVENVVPEIPSTSTRVAERP